MKIRHLLPLHLLISATFACAGENAMSRVEQSCVKVPAPQARADCERRQKESMAAFEKEKKAKQKAEAPSPQKKSDLCFTRNATGEVVCPN